MTVAFFDLDLTLISVNSGKLWVEHQYRQGQLSRSDLVRMMGYLVGYRFAILDIERVARTAVARIAGTPEQAMREEVYAWYDRDVRKHLITSMVAKVDEHRALGHELVLLTASSPYISERVCEDLGLDDFLCTRFETHAGHFTGNLDGPMCYGAGKVTWSQRWLNGRGARMDDAWFYTDSYTDLPMLKAVRHPVVVNPDPRLARWARSQNVPVIHAL